MFRHEATNIKWMLTISILFHLTFLSIIFSSGIFRRSDLFTARHSPFSSVEVSIVNLPSNIQPAASSPPAGPLNVEKKTEVKKTEAIIEKKENNQLTKIEKLRENKVVPSAKTAVSAPEKKDSAEVMQNQTADDSSQSEGSSSAGSAEGISRASANQEARPVAGDSMVSGPVVDMPSFKYDYYLGLIKSKVDNRWSQPVAHNKTRKALIEFTINRKGDVSNVRVADSSGDRYFDQTALRAVTLSTPFPPLPRGYRGDTLKVHYRFIYGEKS